jgi:thiamine pyrophosphate-dependent acetolactate synthase large subunit-like protein
LIRVKQAEHDDSTSTVGFVRSDFGAVATGLGVHGARAANEEELRDALEAALVTSQTTVIDVAVSGEEYVEMYRMIRGAC